LAYRIRVGTGRIFCIQSGPVRSKSGRIIFDVNPAKIRQKSGKKIEKNPAKIRFRPVLSGPAGPEPDRFQLCTALPISLLYLAFDLDPMNF
jgi:hypothetical protein